MTPEQHLKRIDVMCAEYDALKQQIGALFGNIVKEENALVDAMLAAGVAQMKTADGLSVNIRPEVEMRTPRKQFKDDMIAWFKDNGHGAMVQVKEDVPWQTEQKFWKELVESGGALPDFVNEKETVKVNYGGSIRRPREY